MKKLVKLRRGGKKFWAKRKIVNACHMFKNSKKKRHFDHLKYVASWGERGAAGGAGVCYRYQCLSFSETFCWCRCRSFFKIWCRCRCWYRYGSILKSWWRCRQFTGPGAGAGAGAGANVFWVVSAAARETQHMVNFGQNWVNFVIEN